jgi:hypothetical protein
MQVERRATDERTTVGPLGQSQTVFSQPRHHERVDRRLTPGIVGNVRYRAVDHRLVRPVRSLLIAKR